MSNIASFDHGLLIVNPRRGRDDLFAQREYNYRDNLRRERTKRVCVGLEIQVRKRPLL